jgi:hypothetical protein
MFTTMQVLGSFATSVMLPLVHNNSADVDAMAIAKKMSSRIRKPRVGSHRARCEESVHISSKLSGMPVPMDFLEK